MSSLADVWLEQLAAGPLDLARDPWSLPQLREAVQLTSIDPVVLDGSYAQATPDGGVAIELMARWTHQETDLGTIGLELDTCDGYASLEDMHIHVPGQGFGRDLIRQIVGLLEQLELPALRTNAYDVGRYAWARCGFDFLEPADEERVLLAAAEFADTLNRRVELQAINHSWELAAIEGEDVSAAEFAAARGDDPDEGIDGSLTLGKALMLGPSGNEWAGALDIRTDSLSRANLARP